MMKGLKHFIATFLRTSPPNLLWDLIVSFSFWSSKEPSSAKPALPAGRLSKILPVASHRRFSYFSFL